MESNTAPKSPIVNSEMNNYDKVQAYGLTFYSAVSFPELNPGNGKMDVLIRYGTVEELPHKAQDVHRYHYTTPAGVILSWRDVGAFLVRDGSEMILDPLPGVDERKLRPFILGTAMGVLLHQRGLQVFHASVIQFPQGAVAIMARKGYGKSTLAAALHTRGHSMLADDILALYHQNGTLMALPGYPQFKLWPKSIEAIGKDPNSYPSLFPGIEKRSLRVNRDFLEESQPLKAVFVLAPGESNRVVELGKKEALQNIMPHWYGVLFEGTLLKTFGLENHLRDCMSLVNAVPIYRLVGIPSLGELDNLAQVAENYLLKLPTQG